MDGTKVLGFANAKTFSAYKPVCSLKPKNLEKHKRNSFSKYNVLFSNGQVVSRQSSFIYNYFNLMLLKHNRFWIPLHK